MEKDRNTCCEVLRDITLSKNLGGKFLEKALVDVQFFDYISGFNTTTKGLL